MICMRLGSTSATPKNGLPGSSNLRSSSRRPRRIGKWISTRSYRTLSGCGDVLVWSFRRREWPGWRDGRCCGGVEVVVDRLGDRLDGGDPVGHGRVVLGQHEDAVTAAVAGEAAGAVDAPAVGGKGQPAVLDVHGEAGRGAGRETPAPGRENLRPQLQGGAAGGGVQ